MATEGEPIIPVDVVEAGGEPENPVNPTPVITKAKNVGQPPEWARELITLLRMEQSTRPEVSAVEVSIPTSVPVQPVRAHSAFREFQRSNPPEYHGGIDILASTNWLRDVEYAFELSKSPAEEKTLLAVSCLKGEALHWWDFVRANVPNAMSMSWSDFTRNFHEKFVPENRKREMKARFRDFKQGDMTIAQYEAKFTALARFAGDEADTEVKRIERFLGGLRGNIQDRIDNKPYKDRTFRELVDDALYAESRIRTRALESKSQGETSKKQREEPYGGRLGGQSGHSGGRTGGTSRPQQVISSQLRCYQCGSTGHIARYCGESRKCFICQSVDHIARDCPLGYSGRAGPVVRYPPAPAPRFLAPRVPQPVFRPPAPRPQMNQPRGGGIQGQVPRGPPRAFQMTAAGARETHDVVTGNQENPRS